MRSNSTKVDEARKAVHQGGRVQLRCMTYVSFRLERPMYTENYNNEKYFTLGVCTGLEMQIYRRN